MKWRFFKYIPSIAQVDTELTDTVHNFLKEHDIAKYEVIHVSGEFGKVNGYARPQKYWKMVIDIYDKNDLTYLKLLIS